MRHPSVPFLKPRNLVLQACSMVAFSASAQSQFLRSQTITHQVHAGDTLEQLAHRYLGDATLWPALQSHNQVANPYRLQLGAVLRFRCS